MKINYCNCFENLTCSKKSTSHFGDFAKNMMENATSKIPASRLLTCRYLIERYKKISGLKNVFAVSLAQTKTSEHWASK